MKSALRVLAVLAAWSLAQGCHERAPHVSTTRTTAATAPAARAPVEGRSAIVFGEVLRRSCDLAAPGPEGVEGFEHDSAALGTFDKDQLADLARCVVAGRLGDQKLVLIGFTDASGTTEYNRALGLYRAQAARLHLLALGVPDERIVVKSHGERDAQRAGGAEAAASQRRVEVHLAAPSGRASADAGSTEATPVIIEDADGLFGDTRAGPGGPKDPWDPPSIVTPPNAVPPPGAGASDAGPR